MKTICVGGTSSHCGKTELTCLLLKTFLGWAAIKVTPCSLDDDCRRGHECGACQAPSSGYEVVTDSGRLETVGKDTARFIESGASKVVWVRALNEYLPLSLESACGEVAQAQGVIVESTTAMPLLGGVHILVAKPDDVHMKDSARRGIGSVDLLAVNMWPAEMERFSGPVASFIATPSFPICASLGPEHPFNREFIRECRKRIRNLQD